MVVTESSSGGVNNSEAFSTSYCEDNEDYSCMATLLSASPDSAKTSTTTTTSEAAPPRSLLDAKLHVYENVHRLRRTEEHIAGAVTFRRRRNHRELGQILQHALNDRRSRVRRVRPALCPRVGGTGRGGCRHRWIQQSLTRTPPRGLSPSRAMMPTIEEDQRGTHNTQEVELRRCASFFRNRRRNFQCTERG
ncbi:hypothetical protein MRX96_045423 [Rhipicephalus microplus]